MKIERGYAEYSDKAIKREAVKQLKLFKRVPIKQPVAVSEWQN